MDIMTKEMLKEIQDKAQKDKITYEQWRLLFNKLLNEYPEWLRNEKSERLVEISKSWFKHFEHKKYHNVVIAIDKMIIDSKYFKPTIAGITEKIRDVERSDR